MELNMKKIIIGAFTVGILSGCGADYEFKTKSETYVMSKRDVAELTCLAFKELDFDQLLELTKSRFHKDLLKFKNGERSYEKLEKEVDDIDCEIRKYENKRKSKLFYFKNFRTVEVFENDDFKYVDISKKYK
jgi:hypothetical protein